MSDVTVYSELLGKTLASVNTSDRERCIFTFSKGERWVMFHRQDCCESVALEDVTGDVEDIVGSPLLEASEITEDHSGDPDSFDSQTWTFYRFSTIKGTVVMRWVGSSNGYYSERVDFEKESA